MMNMSDAFSVTESIGSKPLKIRATVVADIEDMSSGMIDVAVMSSINISNTNTTPVIGALNIAATAAPAPQHSRSVSSL